jgi:MscS family membrane protein
MDQLVRIIDPSGRLMMRRYPHWNSNDIYRCVLIITLFFQWGGSSELGAQNLPTTVKLATGQNSTTQSNSSDSTKALVEPFLPVDPLGRTSPHGCVLGFLRSAEAKDYEKAEQYLDGKRSPQEGEELAGQLKYLLDQGLSTSIDDLSRSPKGDIEDQLRLSRENIGTVKLPNGELKVMLDLVRHPDEPPVWLFSQETFNLVPGAYANVHHIDLEHFFPAWTAKIRILSVPLWRWGIILFSLLSIFGVASLLTRVTLWLLHRVFKERLAVGVEASVLGLKTPFFCLIVAIMDRLAGGYAITALGRHYWRSAGFVLAWISAAWLLVRLTDIMIGFVRHRLLLRMQAERVTFVTLLGRLFKVLVGLVLVIALLTHAGVNVSALVAGLGIGGIALALAAQKTLADLFGGLSIVMRGAVRVGDFCQIDGINGTVEDIGISALNLRTLDRSVVSIPNAKVAEAALENFSLREQLWLHQIFTLRFDTPHDVVKVVLDQIDQILGSHPEIDKDSARVRLISLTANGPQIEVFAYFQRPGAEWAVFLEQQEKLILKMMRAMESAGTSLAAPIGVLWIDGDKQPSSSLEKA